MVQYLSYSIVFLKAYLNQHGENFAEQFDFGAFMRAYKIVCLPTDNVDNG